MTDFGRRAGPGDMLKSVYDTDDDGYVDGLKDHKELHEDAGDEEILLTNLFGKHLYVDRGDTASPDFTQATLTTNDNWHELDLSDIVDEGATFAYIKVMLKDATPDLIFSMRKAGAETTTIALSARIQVANIFSYFVGFVPMDVNYTIDYWGSNTTWDSISLTVLGWLK